uniref:RING-type domain-containing protein n=1 Tax=Rhodosorus marinus TaxID=101924 RepID=A0A7S3E8Y9_9RHOD|mmetsp:Transcript_15470/g.63107  ORF Transcript_15470/g.63107 Transcript_15470/m.63107 type:complete len:618 (+) Transcript_15470:522-2375(+)
MEPADVRALKLCASAKPFVPQDRGGEAGVAQSPHKSADRRQNGQSSSRAFRRRNSGREIPELRHLNVGRAKPKKNALHMEADLEVHHHHNLRRGYQSKRTSRYESAPFSRERFVQANFGFCIARGGEMHSTGLQTDVFASWSSIEIVLVLSDAQSKEKNCPICLDSLRSPRMTSCGHIYCYLCVLKLMSYVSGSFGRCPLCAENFETQDLKSVDFREITPFCENTEQVMYLLARERESIVVDRFDPLIASPSSELSRYDPMDVAFSRYYITNDEHYLKLLERDLDEIRKSVTEAEDVMEMSAFAEVAEASVRSKRRDVKRRLHASKSASGRKKVVKDGKGDKMEEKRMSEVEPNATKSGSSRAADSNAHTFDNDNSLKFLYQAATGENIYLHPVNVKCLSHEHESFREYPLVIEAKVLEIERYTMSEELRRRYRFLSHLPIGSEFGLCEMDLSSVLQEETLEAFGPDLTTRKNSRVNRRKQAVRERRNRKNKSPAIFEEFDYLHQRLYSAPLPLTAFESADISDVSSFPSLSLPPNSPPEGSSAGNGIDQVSDLQTVDGGETTGRLERRFHQTAMLSLRLSSFFWFQAPRQVQRPQATLRSPKEWVSTRTLSEGNHP